MRDFVIVTDSSGDLPVEIIERYNIKVIPMSITVNGNTYKHYHDYREFSKADYYNALRNETNGSTAGINIQDALDTMREVVEKNEDILFLSLSSGLSGSYQNAVLASEELKEEYPDARIEVIDTHSVCMGVGMLLVLAARAKERGGSFEETLDITRNNIHAIKHYFTVNDLSALQRSGRISHLTALAGSMLNIKPMLTIDRDGRVQSNGKVRGRKASIKQLINNAVNNVVDSSLFIVGHADAIEDADMIRENLMELYPNCEVIISDVGPIIGIHVGAETLAIICMGECD